MLRCLWIVTTLAGIALLAGCQWAGMMALHSANSLAKVGNYSKQPDIPYGFHQRHALDLYIPKHRPQPAPVVIFFHGGDWSDGYPDKDVYGFVGEALTSRGMIAVIPNYRRYPSVRFPDFVEDGAQAVVWTFHHIQAFGGDPSQIFLMGHSAGAHIASMLAVNDSYLLAADGDPHWVRGMIGMAGPYDFPPMPDKPWLDDLFGPPSRFPLAQPVNYVDQNDPPLLLLDGARDTTVPPLITQQMVNRVQDAGGRVQRITYDNVGHIMLLGSFAMPMRLYYRVLDDVAAWIEHVCDNDHKPLQRPADTVMVKNDPPAIGAAKEQVP